MYSYTRSSRETKHVTQELVVPTAKHAKCFASVVYNSNESGLLDNWKLLWLLPPGMCFQLSNLAPETI